MLVNSSSLPLYRVHQSWLIGRVGQFLVCEYLENGLDVHFAAFSFVFLCFSSLSPCLVPELRTSSMLCLILESWQPATGNSTGSERKARGFCCCIPQKTRRSSPVGRMSVPMFLFLGSWTMGIYLWFMDMVHMGLFIYGHNCPWAYSFISRCGLNLSGCFFGLDR